MTARFLSVLIAAVASTSCSTLQDALDYGRGPFDKSPASTSEAALEGLHESSWGNSGKWGGKEPLEDPDDTRKEPGQADPPTKNG